MSVLTCFLLVSVIRWNFFFFIENEPFNYMPESVIGGSWFLVLIISFFYIDQQKRSKTKYLRLKAIHELLKNEISNTGVIFEIVREEGRKEEKERISRELHDGVLSQLFGVRLMLNTFCDKTDRQSVEARRKYIDELKSIEQEIRNISHSNVSNDFNSGPDFLKLLHQYLDRQKKIYGLDFKLNGVLDVCWEEIEPAIKIDLYRILQESIHNTVKYATATQISVLFKAEDQDIKMVVKDNGRGFDKDLASEGMGLRNIETRVSRRDGHLALTSDRNGTRMNIIMPLN